MIPEGTVAKILPGESTYINVASSIKVSCNRIFKLLFSLSYALKKAEKRNL